MSCHHLIEHLFLSMERETEVTDATCLSFLLQEIHDTIVNISAIELLHSTTNGMQQIIVNIVDLQFLHRVEVHLLGLLE